MRFHPLPVRDGLNPTRLVLPHDAASVERWRTAVQYLEERFPEDVERLREKVAAGEVVTGRGVRVDVDTPYEPRGFLFLYRDPPADEPRVLALDELEVLHRDENLLVVDKPHLVATMPRGRWVTQTVLVHLRRTLDLPELALAHRLDRPTAGVLVLTVRASVRGAYQDLFQERRVRKVYEAVAPLPGPGLELPTTVRSRIVKYGGIAAAQEVPGEPNAESFIDLVARDETRGLGLYRLEPHTGKTHQLRLHLASLGMPILHDPFWPGPGGRGGLGAAGSCDRPDGSNRPAHGDTPDRPAHGDTPDRPAHGEASDQPAHGDASPTVEPPERPLQLLARSLAFTDPFTGERRTFTSRRRLAEWRVRG